jgi:hypothetical protein
LTSAAQVSVATNQAPVRCRPSIDQSTQRKTASTTNSAYVLSDKARVARSDPSGEVAARIAAQQAAASPRHRRTKT